MVEGEDLQLINPFNVLNWLAVPGWERLHGSDDPYLQHQLVHVNAGDNPHPIGRLTTSATTANCAISRQASSSSEVKLLSDDYDDHDDSRDKQDEVKVVMRHRRPPPRPKSEVFLDQEQKRRSKRYSAFGVRNHFLFLFFFYFEHPPGAVATAHFLKLGDLPNCPLCLRPFCYRLPENSFGETTEDPYSSPCFPSHFS